MRKTFFFCLMALFALMLGSCSKKEQMTHALVKDINDSVMKIEKDGNRVDVDVRKAIYTAGAVQGGDSIVLNYFGSLNTGDCQAVSVQLLPRAGRHVEAVFDPKAPLKTDNKPVTKEEKKEQDEFYKNLHK
jgi:hypothetical protein